MTHVRLDQVLMPEARKLTLSADPKARVLAETATGDPLYAVIDRPEGKVAVITVDLDKSDLPLQTAFPILMTNCMSWLAGTKGELREALPAGAVAEVELPPEKRSEARRFLRSPGGEERELSARGARTSLGPLDACGIWTVVRRVEGTEGLRESGLEQGEGRRPARDPPRARLQPGRPARERPAAAGGAARPARHDGRRPVHPAGLVLSAGRGLVADLVGVVPLSAKVDRLMGTFPLQIELTRPGWLLGMLVLPVLAYYFSRSLVDFVRWQRLVSLAIRALVVALLVLALAGLSLLRPTREQFVVFAVDQSQSIGEEARKAADDYVARAVAGGGEPIRGLAVRRGARDDPPGRESPAAPEAVRVRSQGARPPGDRPRRGPRGRRRRDSPVLRAEDRGPLRRQRHRRRCPPGRGGPPRQGRDLGRPAPGPDRPRSPALRRQRAAPGPAGRGVPRRGGHRQQPRRRRGSSKSIAATSRWPTSPSS